MRILMIAAPAVVFSSLLSFLFTKHRQLSSYLFQLAGIVFFMEIYQVILPGEYLLILTVYVVMTFLTGLILIAITRLVLPSRMLQAAARTLSYPFRYVGLPLSIGLAVFVIRQASVADRTFTPRRADRPDILFILVDAMRADDLGKIDSEGRTVTPNLDRLAKSGVLFKQAFAPSYTTDISLPAIFTGILPSGFNGRSRVTASPLVPTFVENAFRNGYDTACVTGSGFVLGDNLDRYFRRNIWRTDPVYSIDLAPYVRDYFRSAPDSNRLMYVHLWECHDPYLPKPPFRKPGWSYFGMWRNFLKAKMNRLPGTPELAMSRMQYDAEVAESDAQIGKILDDLDKTGRLEDTVIFVTADHGEAFLEHGVMYHELPALFRELMHVPLVVSYPKALKEGSVVDRPISNARLKELISDLTAGTVDPDRFQERLLGLTSDVALADDGSNNYGFVQGSSKLVRYKDEFFLYDLSSDPEETRNLYSHTTQSVVDLQNRVRQIQQENKNALLKALKDAARKGPGGALVPEGPPMDKYIRDQLKSLGYFQ